MSQGLLYPITYTGCLIPLAHPGVRVSILMFLCFFGLFWDLMFFAFFGLLFMFSWFYLFVKNISKIFFLINFADRQYRHFHFPILVTLFFLLDRFCTWKEKIIPLPLSTLTLTPCLELNLNLELIQFPHRFC